MEIILAETERFELNEVFREIEPDVIVQLILVEMQCAQVAQRVECVRLDGLHVRFDDGQFFELAELGERVILDARQIEIDQFQRAQVDQVESNGLGNLVKKVRVELDDQFFEVVGELDEGADVDAAELISRQIQTFDT